MSDARQETVADVVREMRNGRIPQHRRDDELLRKFADRIEAADHRFREVAKMIPHEEVAVAEMQQPLQPVTDCHGLNAAAMREALEQIANMGEQIDNQLGSSEETVYAFRNERCIEHNISECARSALSAPPRNCDKYTLAESLRKYGFPTKSKPWGEKEWLDFCEWYISESKGYANE